MRIELIFFCCGIPKSFFDLSSKHPQNIVWVCGLKVWNLRIFRCVSPVLHSEVFEKDDIRKMHYRTPDWPSICENLKRSEKFWNFTHLKNILRMSVEKFKKKVKGISIPFYFLFFGWKMISKLIIRCGRYLVQLN